MKGQKMHMQTDDIYREFIEMFMRHRKQVWQMCYLHERRDAERAKDLVQDVSIVLWLHYRDLRSEGCPKRERAWVWWHTRTVLSHYRRKRREGELPEWYEAADEEAQRLAHQRETLEEAMSGLLPVEQEVVRLHLEGYSYEEIAQMTGKTPAAVKQTMYRAIQKMKQLNN